MVNTSSRGTYELNKEVDEIRQECQHLRQELDELRELVFRQDKTIEGIQNLFIRAGEYRGKPRGRLPR